MGQKVSTSEDTGVVATKKDTQDSTIKTKKSTHSSKEKLLHLEQNLKSNFADAEQRLESGDAPSPGQKEARASDEGDNADAGRAEEKNHEESNAAAAGCQSSEGSVAALATGSPNIAELGQLTALRMMRNFEDFHARVDDMLRNEVNEMDDKLMDDNLSEKDFRTISYESLPAVQLVENIGTLKRDSSTFTNETKEFALSDFESVNSDEEKQSCKENGAGSAGGNGSGSASPAAETSTSDDAATALKAEEDGDELARLREQMDRLECERDEARLLLSFAEDRCEAYEVESQCLEASLGGLEEKLRVIMAELGEEVEKSRELERQLSIAIFPQSRDTTSTSSPDLVESLESTTTTTTSID